MKRFNNHIHDWDVTPRQAVALQRTLAAQVKQTPLPSAPRYVCGLDAAFSKDKKFCIAGAVLWDAQRRETVESCFAIKELRFPYIPGLLSFREAPALLDALSQLSRTPDLLICDGQGVAHPRRIGIASHVGVLRGLPSIGCAKSRLTGTHREPGVKRGASPALKDGDEIIGVVLRSQNGVRPLYISVGHRITLKEARALILKYAIRYRLPEPVRLADRWVAKVKREVKIPMDPL